MADPHPDGYTDYPDEPMTDDEVLQIMTSCKAYKEEPPWGIVEDVERLARECIRRGLRLSEFERRDEITVRRNEDGTLDEVVAYGWAHLEQMSDQCWSLVISRGDHRERVNVSLESKGGRAHVSAIVLEPTEHAD